MKHAKIPPVKPGLAAAALQNHLLRSLQRKTGGSSLAEKLGLVAPVHQKLTEDAWTEIKSACLDAGGKCSICLEAFKMKPQVILPCSHALHRTCFLSYERHAKNTQRTLKCPLCRCVVSDWTSFDGGKEAFTQASIVKIQAFARGVKVRAKLAKLPPRMRRSKTLRKMRSITSRLSHSTKKRADFVTCALAQIEVQSTKNMSDLKRNLEILSLKENARLNDTSLATVFRIAAARNDSECAICLEPFKGSESLLSCSHVYHTACLESLEKATESATCPLCRQDYAILAKLKY